MAYFDWHEQPGYFADITRHFEPSAAMLDIGCGTGWLAEHFPSWTGLDGSPDAVERGREKGRTIVLGNVEVDLPFADEQFDGVVVKDLLEHVADPVAVVREARRVLRPGGTIFASSPDAQRWVWNDYTHRRPFTRKAYKMLFSDNGFAVTEARYESVMPGTSIVSQRMPDHRRPAPLRAAAWLPIVRRNVYVVARRAG